MCDFALGDHLPMFARTHTSGPTCLRVPDEAFLLDKIIYRVACHFQKTWGKKIGKHWQVELTADRPKLQNLVTLVTVSALNSGRLAWANLAEKWIH